jgi:hypothetical protein
VVVVEQQVSQAVAAVQAVVVKVGHLLEAQGQQILVAAVAVAVSFHRLATVVLAAPVS